MLDEKQRMALAHTLALADSIDERIVEWRQQMTKLYGDLSTLILAESDSGVTVRNLLPMPTLPQGITNEINVSTPAEFLSAIDTPGPRRIILQRGIYPMPSWSVLGGQRGSDSATHGRDVEIIGNSSIITQRGLTIERGCERVRIYDLAVYTGETTVTPGVAKEGISDPLTVVGGSLNGRSHPIDITVENCAFGFGGDMNVQFQGSFAFINSLTFLPLDNLNHPKAGTSRHAKLLWATVNNKTHAEGKRLQGAILGSGLYGGDDRGPRLVGGFDITMQGSWQAACRLGMSIDDHHTQKGSLQAYVANNEFTTAKQLRRDGSGADATRPFSIYFGVQEQSRLRMEGNRLNGTFYESPESIWSAIHNQKNFGGAYANIPTPDESKAFDCIPVEIEGYTAPADPKQHVIDNAGTLVRDPIQNYVIEQMQACDADPGNHVYELLSSENDLTIDGKSGFAIFDQIV